MTIVGAVVEMWAFVSFQGFWGAHVLNVGSAGDKLSIGVAAAGSTEDSGQQWGWSCGLERCDEWAGECSVRSKEVIRARRAVSLHYLRFSPCGSRCPTTAQKNWWTLATRWDGACSLGALELKHVNPRTKRACGFNWTCSIACTPP